MATYKPLVVVNGLLQQIQSGNYLVGYDGTTSASLFNTTDPIHGFSSLTTTGIVVKTDSAGGVTTRSITSSGTLVFTNPAGVAGNITIDISGTYAGQTSITTLGTITTGTWNGTPVAIAYGGTGAITAPAAFNNLSPITTIGDLIVGSGVNTATRLPSGSVAGTILTNNGLGGLSWAAPAAQGTITSVGISTSTTGLAVSSTTTSGAVALTVNLDAELQALSQMASVGLVARTGTATYSEVTIAGTLGKITVANGNGVGANPTISIDSGYLGQTSITTLGTITTGTWNGTTIAIANGGTGAITAPTAFNNLSPITSIGDLIVGSGVNTATRLGVGLNTQVLTLVGGTPAWTAPATNGTVTSITVTTGTGLLVDNVASATITSTGTFALTLSPNLVGLSGLASTGFVYQTGAGTFTDGAITGSAGRISVSAGASPTIDLVLVTQVSGGTLQNITVDGYGRVIDSKATSLTDLTTVLGTYYLPETGGTMSGPIAMGSNSITGLPTTQSSDSTSAASKAYVDAAVSKLNIHPAIRVATTATDGTAINAGIYANGTLGVGATITLPSTFGGTIDGYTLVAGVEGTGTRVLIKNASNATWNGIYFYSALDVFTRSSDANNSSADQVTAGDFAFASIGTANANTGWVEVGVGTGTNGAIVIGTDAINFTQFSGAGTYTAGTGLSLTGTSFAVNYGAGIGTIPSGDVGINLYSPGTGALILTSNGTTDTQLVGDKLGLLLKASGGLTQDGTGLYIPAAGVTNAMLAFSTITLDADSGTEPLALGNTLMIKGVSNRTVTALSLVSSVPTYSVDISASYVGQATITTLGTITSGIWNSSIIGSAYGGTGINSSAASLVSGNILIGSAGGWTPSTLTSGTGISIVDASGSITINNTGVTNVGLTVPSIFTAGANVTTTGNLSFTLNTELANTIFAGPGSGSAATPTFRTLVASDIPSLSATYLTSVTVSGGTTGLVAGIATPASSTITLSGTLAAVNGGTGISTYTVGDLLVGGATNTLTVLSDVAVGSVLLSGGVGIDPSYGKVNLASVVTGTLPIANGGTGATTASTAFNALAPTTTAGDLIAYNGTSNIRLPVGSSGQVLTVVSGTPTWTSSSSTETKFTNSDAAAITIGQVVYVTATGTVDLALATTAGHALSIGVVADASIASNAAGNIAMEGIVTGLTGLTIGVPYYLSDVTAGLLTSTAPSATGSYIAPIGVAISATAMKISIQPIILL